MKTYTDAEIIEIRTRAFDEAKKYFEKLERDLEKATRHLRLAESFIPLAKKDQYDLIKAPYGGSE